MYKEIQIQCKKFLKQWRKGKLFYSSGKELDKDGKIIKKGKPLVKGKK